MKTLVRRRPSPFFLTSLVGLGVLISGLALAGFSGTSPFTEMLKGYQPRELCMFYEPGVIWLHLVSDVAIALAYYSIPIALIYFVRKRAGLTHKWVYLAFALFILACGTTHVMNVIAIWYAPYRLDGLLKLFTAVVSVMTAAMLWPLLPNLLALPSPGSLRLANAELAREIEVRRSAEDSLRTMQTELEHRVDARTAELRETNAKLQAEMKARSTAEKERESFLGGNAKHALKRNAPIGRRMNFSLRFRMNFVLRSAPSPVGSISCKRARAKPRKSRKVWRSLSVTPACRPA